MKNKVKNIVIGALSVVSLALAGLLVTGALASARPPLYETRNVVYTVTSPNCYVADTVEVKYMRWDSTLKQFVNEPAPYRAHTHRTTCEH